MRRPVGILLACLLAAAFSVTSPVASAEPRWASASRATIHPGVRMISYRAPCSNSANFVFYDASAVYLGQTADCSGPPGTLVRIQGATRFGRVVYNSRSTMATLGDQGVFRFNEFALVRVHSLDEGRVNPSIPVWGGPAAGGARSTLGSTVYTLARPASYCWEDSCRPSVVVDQPVPALGIDTTTGLLPPVPWGGTRDGDAGGWIRYVYTVAPGMALERGGPVLDSRGRALGIVARPAHDAADRVINLSKALSYMRAKTYLKGVRLANGTTRFAPSP